MEKSWARAKNEKTQFPGARNTFGGEIRVPQKFISESAQLFYILRFNWPDPHGREIAKYRGFRPFWPRTAFGAWINSRRKTEERNCAVLGAVFGGKSSRPQSFFSKFRNCLPFNIFPTQTLTGGKSRNTGFQAILAYNTPGHLEKFRAETRKPQFPGARGQKVFDQKERNTPPSARS